MDNATYCKCAYCRLETYARRANSFIGQKLVDDMFLGLITANYTRIELAVLRRYTHGVG